MSESAPAFVHDFFVHYARALLDRDATGIADLYAIPALILFPGQSIAVTERDQVEDFFTSSWGQYEGVKELGRQVTVCGEAPASLWVDVVWSYSGQIRERFCYQLIEEGGEWYIAVITPLAL